MKKIFTFILILMLPVVGFAGGFSKVGTAVAQFLKIGVGARAVGMGETFVAVANDVSTLYWNPAGITNLGSLSVGVSHSQWFADISHDYAGLVVPVSSGDFIGISAIALNTGEQEVTTVEQPNGTGVFYDVSDVAIGLTYSRILTDRFSVGVTVKYIQQTLYNETANTVAVDLGTYLKTGFHNLVVAMSISNFGGSMQLEGNDLIALADINSQVAGEYNPDARLKTEPWPLPLNFRVGIAMDFVGGQDPLIGSDQHRFTLAIDGNHPNDNNERLNFGGEYAWDETVFTRLGYKMNYDIEDWTFGLGFKFKVSNQKIGIDYALVDYNDLGKISRFSLELNF